MHKETTRTEAHGPRQEGGRPRWGQARRLEFIDFRLQWDGSVNRSDITDFFGISAQQASADFASYAERAPGNMVYDRRRKTYRIAPAFAPLFANSDGEAYLSAMVSAVSARHPTPISYVGWHPPFDVVEVPARSVPSHVLTSLVWAIRDHRELRIRYQSMRGADPTERWIAPHAIASDGNRWHARAWCGQRKAFLDFVIARITDIEESRPSSGDGDSDEWWHTIVDVLIRPKPALAPGQRKAIELDFGMTDGHLHLRCRKALAFYLLRRLDLAGADDRPPAEQPLFLENREQFAEVLQAANKLSTVKSTSTNPHREPASS